MHLQVEDPSFVNGKNKNAINLNLPPESNSLNTMNLIDANIDMDPFTSTQGYHSFPFDMPHDTFMPKKSQPAPFTFIVPGGADVPLSTTPVTAVAPSASVSTSEPVVPNMTETTPVANMPVSVPNLTETTLVADTPFSVPNLTEITPVANTPTSVDMLASAPSSASASASASVPVPVDAATPDPFDIDDDTEEKLLKELEEMGFKQVDLNKEILRQNNYNLEQSVDDLCGVNEWDPLLAELEEMVRSSHILCSSHTSAATGF